jgi:hypothetical protein
MVTDNVFPGHGAADTTKWAVCTPKDD